MTWNYRILKRKTILSTGEEVEYYALHEVYYDKKGNPDSYTKEPISFVCDEDETADGIIKSLEMALKDVKNNPVLNENEIGSKKTKRK